MLRFKSITSFIVLFLTSFLTYSQDNQVVHIENIRTIKNFDFNISQVLDLRDSTKNIGAKFSSLDNKKKIVLPDTLESYMKNVFSVMLKYKKDNKKYIVAFHEFKIVETRYMDFSEATSCQIELEILEESNDALISHGIYYNYQRSPSLLVGRKFLSKLILKTLKNCLEDFHESQGEKFKNYPIQRKNLKCHYNKNSIPQKGLYRSFSELARGNPSIDLVFKIKRFKLPKNYPQYYIELGKQQKYNEKVKYFSDGNNIYMSIGKINGYNLFIKNILHGRYLYFESKFKDSVSEQLLGIIGTFTPGSPKAIIIDTKTKAHKELHNYSLYLLIKEYPEILKKYKNSKKKLKDKKNAIVELNDLLKNTKAN